MESLKLRRMSNISKPNLWLNTTMLEKTTLQSATSIWFLNTSKDGDSVTSLGSFSNA